MTEFDSLDAERNPGDGSFRRALWKQAPYLAALFLAIAGVAYSNISHQSLVGYWEFLAIAIGIICIVTHWNSPRIAMLAFV